MDVLLSFEFWLRLLVLVSLVLGAWQAWKAQRPPLRIEGKRYYRQPDGSYRTLWGWRIRDPELVRRLREMDPDEIRPDSGRTPTAV